MLVAVFDQTILAGLYVESVFAYVSLNKLALYGTISSKIDQRESRILHCLYKNIAQPLKFVPYAWP